MNKVSHQTSKATLATVEGPFPVEIESVQQWKSFINKANLYFLDGNYKAAIPTYKAAIKQALANCSEELAMESTAAIAAVLVSFSNLADAYAQVNRFTKGIAQFERAHEFLRAQGQQPSSTCRAKAAKEAKNRLHFEWCHYVKEHQDKAPLKDVQRYELKQQALPSKPKESLTRPVSIARNSGVKH